MKEVNEYITKYQKYLEHEREYSMHTIASYTRDLQDYEQFLKKRKLKTDIRNATQEDIEDYLAFLYGRHLNKNTISRRLSGLRGFYKYLSYEEIIKDSPIRDISNPKKEQYLPKFLSEKELDQIFSICNTDTKVGQRENLIIELLYATGLRVSELVNIKIENIDMINKTIKVVGKGSKERIVIYNNHTAKALKIYLDDAYQDFNKKNSEYLILNQNGDRLSSRYVRNIIDNLSRRANLNIKISPHTIRHTFATDMLNEGADLMTVKELLGHESLNTTSIYTHITNEQIKKTYDMAHPRAKK